MADQTDFPATTDEITAEWMSGALATALPGVEVTKVDVLDAHSGTTGRMRIGLEYASGPSGPETLFIKLPPFDEEARAIVAMVDMGRQEARFYEGPVAEAPLRVPKAYYAAHGDEPTQYIMVLEDLQAIGVVFNSLKEPHAEKYGGKLIESLGRLHAHFWNDPRFDDELSWVKAPVRNPMSLQFLQATDKQFGADFPPVFGELTQLMVDNHARVMELWAEGEQTLIHGDTHAGNQFVDGDTVGLYDWAVTNKSPGIRDVSIYLGNSCPTDVRRSEQEAWLRRYHEVLVESGVDAPSFDVLWNRYRLGVLYGWVAAATTAAFGDKLQPLEVSMLGMARATEACADLDTLGAFRDAL